MYDALSRDELQRLSTRDLFHRIWTRATPPYLNDYEKEEWIEMERRLLNAGLIPASV